MHSQRRSALRHVFFELRGGFLLVPGGIMVLLGSAGLGLLLAEEHIAAVADWSISSRFSVPRDAGAAQYVLSAIAASIMTVLSVVYSVLLLVLTFASMQFSPRIIVTFMKDRVSQVTLGAFLGTFAVCLVTLPAIHSGPKPFVPTLAVTFAMALAATSIVCLLYFVHNMALSIQPNRIVQRIAIETEAVIDALFDPEVRNEPTWTSPAESEGAKVQCLASGYIQYIDVRGLVAAAKAHNVVIRMNRAIGQFMPKGGAIVTLFPKDHVSPACERKVLRSFDIAPVRTMVDDVDFGLLQIVDIGVKAVSPAVNDPSTAIACVDYISHILTMAATKRPPSPYLFDNNGALRVVLIPTNFPRLLAMSFDQMAHYAKGDMAVCLRMLRALRDVAEAARETAHLSIIRARARTVYELCAEGFDPDDRVELTERMDQIERITEEL